MLYSTYRYHRLAELMQEEWGALRIPGLLHLIAMAKPNRVLEIGSFRGVSTEVFLLRCQKVTVVDPWPDLAIVRDFVNRCSDYPHLDRVVGYSPGALECLAGKNFDLCYIDGNHDYENVKADILACQRLFPNALLAGHDYAGVDTPGVEQAVMELLGNTVIDL